MFSRTHSNRPKITLTALDYQGSEKQEVVHISDKLSDRQQCGLSWTNPTNNGSSAMQILWLELGGVSIENGMSLHSGNIWRYCRSRIGHVSGDRYASPSQMLSTYVGGENTEVMGVDLEPLIQFFDLFTRANWR